MNLLIRRKIFLLSILNHAGLIIVCHSIENDAWFDIVVDQMNETTNQYVGEKAFNYLSKGKCFSSAKSRCL